MENSCCMIFILVGLDCFIQSYQNMLTSLDLDMLQSLILPVIRGVAQNEFHV